MVKMAFTTVTVVAVMVLISPVCSVNSTNLTAFPRQVSYLTSPNYPSNYNDNEDLQWLIYSPSGFVVKVTVLNATMEPCCDFVQIYDGICTFSPTLVKFYSMPNQTVYYSSGQYMCIRFFTDVSVTYSGFRLAYEDIPTSVCAVNPANLSAVPGQKAYLTSPNYPSNYSNDTNCGRLIIAPVGFVVKANVMDVSLELGYDFVEIFDGMSTSSPTLVKFYSMPNQTEYHSSGQYMYIRFFTDVSVTSSGFRLTYEATPTSAPTLTTPTITSTTTSTTTASLTVCSVNASSLYVVPGQVRYQQSPNYPFNYYNNADCRWLMIASSGYIVKVTVLDVHLETCCDYLAIYDGLEPFNSSLIIRMNTMPLQTVFYSSGQYMYIKFYSDHSVTYSGFRLTYEAIVQSGPTVPTTTSETSDPCTCTCSCVSTCSRP